MVRELPSALAVQITRQPGRAVDPLKMERERKKLRTEIGTDTIVPNEPRCLEQRNETSYRVGGVTSCPFSALWKV